MNAVIGHLYENVHGVFDVIIALCVGNVRDQLLVERGARLAHGHLGVLEVVVLTAAVGEVSLHLVCHTVVEIDDLGMLAVSRCRGRLGFG